MPDAAIFLLPDLGSSFPGAILDFFLPVTPLPLLLENSQPPEVENINCAPKKDCPNCFSSTHYLSSCQYLQNEGQGNLCQKRMWGHKFKIAAEKIIKWFFYFTERVDLYQQVGRDGVGLGSAIVIWSPPSSWRSWYDHHIMIFTWKINHHRCSRMAPDLERWDQSHSVSPKWCGTP